MTRLGESIWGLVNTLGDWLLPIIELPVGHGDLLCGLYIIGQCSLFQYIPMGTRSFSICQMFVLSKTFIPYEQFDLDFILKVTAAIYILTLADSNGSTKLLQASNQAVLGVLLFASTNMG